MSFLNTFSASSGTSTGIGATGGSSFMQAGGLGLVGSGISTIGNLIGGGQQNKLAQTNLKATQEQTKLLAQQNELEKTRLAQLQAAATLPKTDEKKPNQLLWWGLGIVGTVLSGLLIYFITRKSR